MKEQIKAPEKIQLSSEERDNLSDSQRLPSWSSQFIPMQMWDHLVCQPPLRPPWSFSCCLAASPLCPSCQGLLLLRVWVNVSSLTPWLSDFHTVQFSGSSGYVLFLYLLSSFFWLCKEAKCIYLCLHLGWKSFWDLSLIYWVTISLKNRNLPLFCLHHLCNFP